MQSQEMKRHAEVMGMKEGDEEEVPAAQKRFQRLTQAIADVLDDYSMVNFAPLSAQDKDTIAYVTRLVDKANGFSFSGIKKGQVSGDTLGLGRDLDSSDILDLVEERYLHDPDDPYGEKSSSDEELMDTLEATPIR
mmetsp:Transcript_37679/g.58819  ORF Transcript_37679/g.58819 Transcript_37679/m.58819 type:complete len:136 (+) Transcript_37679:602-1009(+)